MNDIIINRIQSMQRHVERAREEYRKNPAGFDTDYMVGFRNTVIHEYKKLDMGIVKSVIEGGLDDLLEFTDKVMEVYR
jgi:uncharacterized protein with HEPN domain